MKRVAVIGGGPAGMMCAIRAAQRGLQVDLYEQNEKLGKKLFITGKGRCNLTNACPGEEFENKICTNPRFLYSAFHKWSNKDTMDFFESRGLKLKTERGERVFPASDHSSDVIRVLERQLKECGVRIHLNTRAESILTVTAGPDGDGTQKKKVRGVRLGGGSFVEADAVIVCTGGMSYASTGSTGDGYRFAREMGHTVTPLSPSLVPLEVAEEDAAQMQGLSLRNVKVRMYAGKKVLFEDLGEMLFTHFGVSGPLILTASTCIQKELKKGPVPMEIDLKPALAPRQLDERLLRDFGENVNRQFKNSLGGLYPARLIPVIIKRSGINPEKPVHDLTRGERLRLGEITKRLAFTVTSLRGYSEAIITRGGVSVRQVRPDTMESKLTEGLYFAGEVLDLDAVTGGFNLQIAWSTGFAAGDGVG